MSLTSQARAAETLAFYIGTAVDASQGGIYLSSVDLETGALAEPKLVASTDRSTFLHLHPTLPVLYSVAELSDGEKGKGAAILSWKIDSQTGMLSEQSHQPAGGQGACHVTVRDDGQYAAIANYGSGSISLYPLADNGAIKPATANIQHQGSGPDQARQMAPHAHSTRFDASGNKLLAADLGTDDIFIYDIASDGQLSASATRSLRMAPGSGPRHFVFSPDHRFVLALGEMSGTIATFDWNPVKPTLVSTVSTMAPATPADSPRHCAEILFHPKLPVVYCSNRGPNEIAAFDFDVKTGELKRRSAIPCGGKTPRNFRLTPDGRYLLVANQGSNQVSVFGVDTKTGDLLTTEHGISVPAPMCIKFVGDRSP